MEKGTQNEAIEIGSIAEDKKNIKVVKGDKNSKTIENVEHSGRGVRGERKLARLKSKSSLNP